MVDSGEKAWRRYVEFFTAHIRYPNTRAAYAHAANRFCRWCRKRGIRDLGEVSPFAVAAYIEHLTRTHSAPTVKQALAAIRMLFDFLVVGQVIPVNPAASVRGPKHVVNKGKTPVLSAAEARELLASIDVSTIAGLSPRIETETTNTEIIVRMVEAGLGIALVPLLSSGAVTKGRKVTVRSMSQYVRPIQSGVLKRRGQRLSATAEAFLTFL